MCVFRNIYHVLERHSCETHKVNNLDNKSRVTSVYCLLCCSVFVLKYMVSLCSHGLKVYRSRWEYMYVSLFNADQSYKVHSKEYIWEWFGLYGLELNFVWFKTWFSSNCKQGLIQWKVNSVIRLQLLSWE